MSCGPQIPVALGGQDARHHPRPTGLGDVAQRQQPPNHQITFFAGVSSLAAHAHSGAPSPWPFPKDCQTAFTFRIRTCFSRLYVWSVHGADAKFQEAGFFGTVKFGQLWANCSQLVCECHCYWALQRTTQRYHGTCVSHRLASSGVSF